VRRSGPKKTGGRDLHLSSDSECCLKKRTADALLKKARPGSTRSSVARRRSVALLITRVLDLPDGQLDFSAAPFGASFLGSIDGRMFSSSGSSRLGSGSSAEESNIHSAGQRLEVSGILMQTQLFCLRRNAGDFAVAGGDIIDIGGYTSSLSVPTISKSCSGLLRSDGVTRKLTAERRGAVELGGDRIRPSAVVHEEHALCCSSPP